MDGQQVRMRVELTQGPPAEQGSDLGVDAYRAILRALTESLSMRERDSVAQGRAGSAIASVMRSNIRMESVTERSNVYAHEINATLRLEAALDPGSDLPGSASDG